MFYILEMANNHAGSVKHGKLIIDKFAEVCNHSKINAAIKLQFRQLDTFIHRDYIESDLKYVKRFKETRLSKNQFKELADYSSLKGFKTCATAFDNASIPWFKDLDISVIKVASCSIDDWPLLEEVSDINKKIIISTAGATVDLVHKVYNLFKSKGRDFAFMHCVGDYPTRHNNSNLKRIKTLRREFPDIEIGYSTHESPKSKTTSVYALAMGCTILEKHVGVATKDVGLNDYSLSPEDLSYLVSEIEHFEQSYSGHSETESESLRALKRGMYFSKEMTRGQVISERDLYFSLPVQVDNEEHHFDASDIANVVGRTVSEKVLKDSAVNESFLCPSKDDEALAFFKKKISSVLEEAKIHYKNEPLEISCHFGLFNFHKTGCAIINRVNREYCKKLIIVLPNQSHPTHRHIQKEECFELLHGDCIVKLANKEIRLQKGEPLLVPRGVNHSFRSELGCVVEEISTTHIKGDSIYDDPNINKLPLEKRKILISL
jgi:N-acetylneuraminate synthase